jgi:hypothetical protein
MAIKIRAVAVDPLALILRSDVYVRLHLPDPPPDEALRGEIRDAVAQMSKREMASALASVERLAVYTSALKRELNRQMAKM